MSKILIVEDEAAIADTLIYALQAEGFATHWLTVAAEALALLEREPFDLVILDVGLPDISGFEACKRLRRFSEVPVIFLTAHNAEIDRVVGLEIGADDYVVKPFSLRELRGSRSFSGTWHRTPTSPHRRCPWGRFASICCATRFISTASCCP
ncbi:response regulator [Microbulbifer sp. 2205BS26-8]|uniref:response regulator n=1 Tax=Microbulbifer sp. 2205BS26-8 TaxID=3064386 RepID=UPI00273DE812|nr:response regulator [Microbulbifer sp. 2205BS26-8]MDP5210929.1 response regulator [Microbulbifer sp. 2205BS26-8]